MYCGIEAGVVEDADDGRSEVAAEGVLAERVEGLLDAFQPVLLILARVCSARLTRFIAATARSAGVAFVPAVGLLDPSVDLFGVVVLLTDGVSSAVPACEMTSLLAIC